MTTVKYIETVPFHADEEVRAAALRIFQDSRRFFNATNHRGNDTLKHCETVAMTLVRTYVLMQNQGGTENAVLYAKVADLFGALWYYSGNAQRRIKYRALKADLYPAGAAS
jgi:CRISPR/Cas system CMR-associated protein Cmr3 (group 5 of RAMP superfamily)